MEITTESAGSRCVRLALAGELDMSTVGRLRQAITDAIDTAQPKTVIVDLDQVSFCDSSGIAALIQARTDAAANAVGMTVANPHGMVRRVLEMTGVLDTLTRRP